MVRLSDQLLPPTFRLTDTDCEDQAIPHTYPPHARRSIAPLRFQVGSKSIAIWRLTDGGYYSWHQKSIPIFDDGYFIMKMRRALAAANRPLDFPRIYLALKRRFGPSSQLLDEWKEAFAFPFLLQLESDNRTIQYVLTIASFRSSLEFRFRRQWLGMERLDRAVIRHPFKKEFSRDEMNDCAGYFLEYLSLYVAKCIGKRRISFHLSIPSDHILFGCQRGRFYEIEVPDERIFERLKKQALAGSLAAGKPSPN